MTATARKRTRNYKKKFVDGILTVPVRLLLLVSFVILLFLPFMNIGSNILYILTTANILALLGIGWDIIGGHVGQFNLGIALYLGLGAYVSGIICSQLKVSPIVSIPITLILGSIVALLTGFPALRIKGPYFMLLSFAWPILATGIVDFFPTYTGADSGLRLPGLFPFLSYSMRYQAYYFLSLTILVVVAVVAYHITHRSRIGLAFISILDDPIATAACGISVTRYKLIANVMSGFVATLSGCLLGHFNANAYTSLFGMSYIFLPIYYVIIGGIGTIFGAILGAYILTILDLVILASLPSQYAPAKMVFQSIVVILVLWKFQGGLAKYIGRLLARFGKKSKQKGSKG